MPAYNGPGEKVYTEIEWSVKTDIAYDVYEMIGAAYRRLKEYDLGEDFFRIEADGEGSYRIWYRKDQLEHARPARVIDRHEVLERTLEDLGLYEGARRAAAMEFINRQIREQEPLPEVLRRS